MDLFTNIVVAAGSAVLFCYWFRYTCMLILMAETPHRYSEEVAEANQLAFPDVRAQLRKHPTDLACVHKSLERDFAILLSLLDVTQTAKFEPGIEEAMLMIHFRTLSACFRMTSCRLRVSAADALEEMSRVVVHLADELGERQATAG